MQWTLINMNPSSPEKGKKKVLNRTNTTPLKIHLTHRRKTFEKKKICNQHEKFDSATEECI